MAKQTQDIGSAAQALIEQSRKQLLRDVPELLPAVYLMKAEPIETPGPLCSDGLTLFYHPETVVRDYLDDHSAIATQLLHILCHGLQGHFERRRGQLAPLFDAVADLTAGVLALRIDKKYARKMDAEHIRAGCRSVDALYLSAQTKAEVETLVEQAAPYRVDDHALWDLPKQNGNRNGMADQLRKLWQNAVTQVAAGMSKAGKGDAAGMLSEIYRETEGSPISYGEFLKRFCSVRERSVVDPDSINRIWYHVGLGLTGDTPIVEPDELREERTLEHIAVAVDTSGSCSGEVMEGFLRELLAVLRDGGGPKVEFTLIQCDAEIQKVETLCAEDFAEQICAGMSLHGWGGTDFCPVFDYVNAQREREDGVKFAGLIYFTDGWGDYPKEKPDYPVAFCFPRGESEDGEWGFGFGCDCPDWITKVYVTPEGGLRIEENEGGAFK